MFLGSDNIITHLKNILIVFCFVFSDLRERRHPVRERGEGQGRGPGPGAGGDGGGRGQGGGQEEPRRVAQGDRQQARPPQAGENVSSSKTLATC